MRHLTSYGTQFVKSRDTGEWTLYTIDETAASDADRTALGVPPLAEARLRAATIK
jgi:hypothetical protein